MIAMRGGYVALLCATMMVNEIDLKRVSRSQRKLGQLHILQVPRLDNARTVGYSGRWTGRKERLDPQLSSLAHIAHSFSPPTPDPKIFHHGTVLFHAFYFFKLAIGDALFLRVPIIKLFCCRLLY
jgi:hypothetical protein